MKRPGRDKPRLPGSPAAWLLLALLSVWVVFVSVGCSPPSARHGGFESENPASLIYAIRQAGQSRDAAAVPELVEALAHDDPAVRMMAITALQAITGQRLAYNPYQSYEARYDAMNAWRDYARQARADAKPIQP